MRPTLPSGLTVRYSHFRHPLVEDTENPKLDGGPLVADESRLALARELRKEGYPISAKGGLTSALIFRDEDLATAKSCGTPALPIAVGSASCCPADNFCRRIGRDISLGRALRGLHSSEVAT